MANETPVQAPIEQSQQASPNANPIVEAPKVPANNDAELNDSLSNFFANKIPIDEPKPIKEEPKLEKAPEKQVESKKPTEKVKQEPKQQTELPKPEALDENPPKQQDGWTALKNNYKRAHKVISEREEEIARLKSGLAEKAQLSTKELENLRNEIKELSKYRTMVDIQADPEFISKYDQPIEKAQNSVKEMLVSMQVSKEIVDQVDFGNTKLMDEIIGHVGEHRDKITARRLQRKVEEIVDLMEKRGETLSEQKTNYTKFMEDKKKESSLKGAEDEGRIFRHLENIAAAKDQSGNVAFPFLSKIPPKDGASQAENDQIGQHNHVVEMMQQKLQQAIGSKTPEERAEVAVAAVASHYLNAQVKALMAKNKALEAELTKISAVSTDTEKNKPSSVARAPNDGTVDLDTALNNFRRNR